MWYVEVMPDIMPDIAFVVVQHDWDNMENHAPQEQKPVACGDTRKAAERWIEEAKTTARPYQGWNKQTYPQWTIAAVLRVR